MEKFNQPQREQVSKKGMTFTERGFQASTGLTPPLFAQERPDGNSEVSVNPDYLLENFEIRSILALFNTGDQDFSRKTAESYNSISPAIVKITPNGSFALVQKGELRLKSGSAESSPYVSSQEITTKGERRFTIKIPKKEVVEPIPVKKTEGAEITEGWTEEDERELEELSKILDTNAQVISQAEKRLDEIKALLETMDKEERIEFIADSGAASLAKMNTETKEVSVENQDSYFSSPESGSFAVLDGVGGHASGEIASRTASEVIKARMSEMDPNLTEQERVDYIKRSVEMANNAIIEKAEGDRSLTGMATTLSFANVFEDEDGKQKAVVVSVGDSRIYVFRKNGGLEQITKDDSWIRSQLEQANTSLEKIEEIEGKLNNAESEEELGKENIIYWNNRNVIQNGLGVRGLTVKTEVVDLRDVTKIIISSDGVHDILTSDKIEKIVSKKQGSTETAKELTETAQRENYGFRQKARGDDITAVVIELKK